MRHLSALKEATTTISTLKIFNPSKERYYSRLSMKLMEPSTSLKTYWSVLKSFHNNKKIPCIPSIFHENRFVTNLKKKSQIV